jgi:hypothetical protein
MSIDWIFRALSGDGLDRHRPTRKPHTALFNRPLSDPKKK